nr:PREDICTED: uncharacterized protein LOC103995761 isoform X2 [Musa acuminata subsp. malaccensis]
MRWSMRLKLPIRSLRCQGEDGADHSNPGKLLLDGEWEITTTQLDLLPAHALKLRQVSPGMVHREESLTLVCRPHEAKLEQLQQYCHTSGIGLLQEQRLKDHHKTSQVNTQSTESWPS